MAIEIEDSKERGVEVRITCDIVEPGAWLSEPTELTPAQNVAAFAIEAITKYMAVNVPEGTLMAN